MRIVGLPRGAGAIALLSAVAFFGLAALAILFPQEYEGLLIASVLAVVAAMAALVTLRWPAAALVAIVVSGLVMPLQVATGTRTALHSSLLLTGLVIVMWLLRMCVVKGQVFSVDSRVALPVVLLMCAAVLSFIVGQFPWFPPRPAPMMAQLAGLSVFLFSGGIFVVSAHEFRDVRWLKRATAAFLIAGAVHVALLFMVNYAGGRLGVRPMASPGSLFWVWFTALALAQAWFNDRLSLVMRLVLAASSLAALWVAFFRHGAWASGWLPAAFGVFVMIAARRPIVGGACALLGSGLCLWRFDDVARVLWTAEQHYSYLTRVEAAKTLFGIVKANPLLGLGPSNYYHYTSQYPILGWYVPFSSHNNYIDVLAQTGVLGLISLIWLLGALGILALRLKSRADLGFNRAYVYGVIGGLGGTLCAAALGDWFLPFVYNVGLAGFSSSVLAWVFLGGLVAVQEGVRRRSDGGEGGK